MKRIYSEEIYTHDTSNVDPDFEKDIIAFCQEGKFNQAIRYIMQEYDAKPLNAHNWLMDFMKQRGINKQSSDRKTIVNAKKSPAWQREEGKSNKGGLNEKGRKSYEKENPGSDLKPPVTEDKPKGERKKRQDSYCARSKGQMNDNNIDCSKTPDKPICKSRKRWSC